MIPLILRLKKAAHKKIAQAQDILVETAYESFNDAVLHGGTAIWRCYNGKRFSEDVDFYIAKDIKKINKFYSSLEDKGFLIIKKKIGANSIYSTLEFNKTVVKFEALFKRINGSLKEYEKAEGNFITVYTLLPEELIKEKIEAYLKRLKIRDLYDIFFLLRYTKDTLSIKRDLNRLINNFKKPADEKDLRILIMEGISPSVDEMVSYIKRRI